MSDAESICKLASPSISSVKYSDEESIFLADLLLDCYTERDKQYMDDLKQNASNPPVKIIELKEARGNYPNHDFNNHRNNNNNRNNNRYQPYNRPNNNIYYSFFFKESWV